MFAQSTFGGEVDVSVNQSKQSVVLANANIHAGVELGSTLTHNDCTCSDELAAEGFNAQHLWLGVSSISR